LNGDGDTDDSVVHVYDVATGTTTNLGLANTISFEGASIVTGGSGNLVAFTVNEFDQGHTDLNGDGEVGFDRFQADTVIHPYDAPPGTTTNLGLAITVGLTVTVAGVSEDLVAFSVSESDHGGADLNGDGDTYDQVVHVYNAGTGTTTNLGLDGLVD